MPNWCTVEMKVEAEKEATKQSIMDLILKDGGNGKKEVDFEIVAPAPKAIDGILQAKDDKVSLNRAHEDRLGELTLKDFVYKLNHQVERKKQNPILKAFFGLKENTENSGEPKPIVLTKEQKEHITKIENAILGEIKNNSDFTLDTPVENIIDVLLTKEANQNLDTPYNDDTKVQLDYVRSKLFPEEMIYLIDVLEQDIEWYCEKKYGAPNRYYWQRENWGTKWNGGDIWESEDWDFSFDTAWEPPEEWFNKLASKINEMGLKDYGVTMRYSEPGNWFGGMIINDDGDIMSYELDDDELRELFGFEDEDEEDIS